MVSIIASKTSWSLWGALGASGCLLGASWEPPRSLLVEKGSPGFFRKYKNSLLRCFLMKFSYYKEKFKSRFDRKIEMLLGSIKSNPLFYRKPNIILWSLRSFWVGRFALNQSLKFGFGWKPFLCQCKKWNQSRLFPKSRFWDVGMEFRDVGCVRIPFAINSKPFSTHSYWKSIKSYWNRPKINILASFWHHFHVESIILYANKGFWGLGG